LDENRRARRGIGICRARGEHTKGPVIFSVLGCNAIDRDFLHVMTAGLLSHTTFLKRAKAAPLMGLGNRRKSGF
jgi:hypothetical protein